MTARPIGEEITHRIIDRLGLEETSWPTTGDQSIPTPHPQGYLTYDPKGKPTAPVDVTELDPSLGWAAGQLISTPSDLGTFFRALLGGELLEPAQQEEMETVVPAEGFEPEPGWGYGLGLATKKLSCGVDGWGHGGDIQGFETRDLVTRDGRSAVIALTTLPAEPATDPGQRRGGDRHLRRGLIPARPRTTPRRGLGGHLRRGGRVPARAAPRPRAGRHHQHGALPAQRRAPPGRPGAVRRDPRPGRRRRPRRGWRSAPAGPARSRSGAARR